MDTATVFLIAVGLAMDAFAVSITTGFTARCFQIKYALRVALLFGGFQAIMPIIGYLAGLNFRESISSYSHWVAFFLLAAIGTKMIWESWQKTNDDSCPVTDEAKFHSLFRLFALAIATSIDALAVGVGISLLNVDIFYPAIVIGIVTFIMSIAGVYLGNRFGHSGENRMEFIGGLILIAIGFKILLEG
ncbi:manganese efflux pump MntP family protein [Chrysiogenes arsenatis]|uniref:manganese efflux pump MntP n=1 Tax=Chrysiogenes arsenatis TaxID=309797 RepID=UPI00040EAE84|nr:manganese efflux pump MntP family protein [Chrysiogenes arsenatis]